MNRAISLFLLSALCAWSVYLHGTVDLFAAQKTTNSKELPVRSYMTLYPGSGGACAASKKNADAKNNHDKRHIQATFREGGFTVTKDFAPGESRTVGFCNYGKLRMVSAKYVN
jgi:hypothetical protein